jgi:type IV pilus assembly protein PilX
MGESVMKFNYRNKQQGVVLVIALIALVAISLAGVALMRSVDTSNVVSGNIAFNETAIQMADVGAERAYTEILGNLASNPNSCQFIQANCPHNSAGQYYFYPNVSSLDAATKLPTPTGGLAWSDANAVTLPGDTAASYFIQYIIERMCGNVITGATATPGDNTANSQETATFAKCRAAPLYDSNGNPSIGTGKLFYRITVQVTGPRNTRGLAQYFYGVQDTVN